MPQPRKPRATTPPDPPPPASSPTSARRIAVAIVAAIALIGVAVTINAGTDENGHPHRTVTITLGKPAAPGAVSTTPATVTIPADVARQVAAGDVGNHDDLKGEQPIGASRADLEAAAAQQDELARTDALPIVTPDAAPEQRGCATRLVRNYSSRRGVRPRLLVAHYTVSPNRPGWSDVWGVVHEFDLAAFAASSNYVIDGEGHCAYIVRESDKAWTQAAANPVSISAELVNSGREGVLEPAAGLAKVGEVFADAAKRWAIPLQLGKVSGCTVVRPGIVDHHSLGACGGGHYDVSPYSVQAVIDAARRAGGSVRVGAPPRTPTQRRRCAALRHHRVAVRTHRGKWSDRLKVRGQATSRARRARYLKGALRRDHVAEGRCK